MSHYAQLREQALGVKAMRFLASAVADGQHAGVLQHVELAQPYEVVARAGGHHDVTQAVLLGEHEARVEQDLHGLVLGLNKCW